MPPESLTLSVVRPDDLLVLTLQFDGAGRRDLGYRVTFADTIELP